jgi:hypothetical protein
MIKYFVAGMAFFYSCNTGNTIKTVYSYQGVSITRIDENRESYFYYGDFIGKKPDTTVPHVKASFPLGSDIMEGYLVFKADKRVTLVAMTSNFIQKESDSLFSIFTFKENVDFINWDDSVKKKFDNLIRISENPTLEKRLHKQFGSKVQLQRIELIK